MMHGLALESFDSSDDLDAGDTGTFQDGFDAGLAAAQLTYDTDQKRLTADLTQSVADIAFNYAEARAEIVQSLSPFISTLMKKVLPQVISDGFILQVIALVEDTAHHAVSAPLSMIAHPDQCAALSAALAQTYPDIVIAGDSTLSRHNVSLCNRGQGVMHDMDGLAQEIGQILRAALPEKERAEKHG